MSMKKSRDKKIKKVALGIKITAHAVESISNCKDDITEKGADIMRYQITMRTCTVAIYQTPRFKCLLLSLAEPIKTRPATFN
jgi:hypothetical protein